MKISAFLLIALFLSLPLTSFTTAPNTGTVTIEVEGLKNSSGTVRIGVYNKNDKFLEDAGVIKAISAKISGGKCKLEAADLNYGSYSFALLHDQNDNKKMDYNWMGIPQEGFGFSNNPKIGFGAPSFDETKIVVDSPSKSIKIVLKYM